mmetsp:Transcript_79371/g.157268  ORF Transcript_79371/g.157268 Transcript_79371/m.157268 type:complete len:266 (-) Transcript_79371:340-1137(-)|eukprot:CAMPEP_0172678514 /NCGR_PEP_ID=MMETSP1074-20121228/15456_1 /TAXON_ID=2916 /ORGANISM="Ceratium fusus, Strain PA161109" /LENGTH=265 /DNA_ID=CAMNT_0013496573 /DNA_START=148 /DNA_END=945 /DNA_ORIENTATION=-
MFGSCGVIVTRNSCADLELGPSKVLIRGGLHDTTSETEREQRTALLHPECNVEILGHHSVEDAEVTNERGLRGCRTTLVTPPVELLADLPIDHVPGTAIQMMGPHGPIDVVPPRSMMPGSQIRYRLAPPPELRVEVPADTAAGSTVQFERPDGVRVAVIVPPGLGPGDTFEVTPPSLMVKIPPDALPGDRVAFQVPPDADPSGRNESPWCCARIPGTTRPGSYFPVRIPAPRGPRSMGQMQGPHGLFLPVASCTSPEWIEDSEEL